MHVQDREQGESISATVIRIRTTCLGLHGVFHSISRFTEAVAGENAVALTPDGVPLLDSGGAAKQKCEASRS